MRKFLLLAIAGGLACVFTGCATIVKDDSQPVAFSSTPQGATISINGVPRGTTPATIMVKRSRKKQMVQYDLAGYKTEIFPLDKSVAGMTFGNIIFGGIIGIGVDIATGKATNYDDSVQVKLIPLSPPAEQKPAVAKSEPEVKAPSPEKSQPVETAAPVAGTHSTP